MRISRTAIAAVALLCFLSALLYSKKGAKDQVESSVTLNPMPRRQEPDEIHSVTADQQQQGSTGVVENRVRNATSSESDSDQENADLEELYPRQVEMMALYRQTPSDQLDAYGQSWRSRFIARYATTYPEEFSKWADEQFSSDDYSDETVRENAILVSDYLAETFGDKIAAEFQLECAVSLCRLIFSRTTFLEIRRIDRLEDRLDRGVFIDVPLVGTRGIGDGLMQSFIVRRDAPIF